MISKSISIAKFTIIELVRNRLLWLSLLIVVVSFGLTEFIGDLAITEQSVTQVAILAAFLRVSAVVVVALFVVSSTLRELQDKTLLMILAMSIPRSSYYLGKLIGFVSISLLIAVIFSSLLLLYASVDQVLIWCISLFLELVLVVAFGLVMLFSFKQIPAALTGVFIFYVASRSIASIYLMSKYPIISHTTFAQQFLDGFVAVLSWLLPDLNRYTQTDWLAYDSGKLDVLLPLMGQSVIYLALLSAVALFDFYRKNF
jgi:ABC-type transport system involved in multi-copper enzyme maturation permease subunit